MAVFIRLVVVTLLLAAPFARAQDDTDFEAEADAAAADDEEWEETEAELDEPAPAATEPAPPKVEGPKKQLEAESMDGYGCFSFAGRLVGIPALLLGGTLLLTGWHALTVADTLTATGIGAGGYWTNFGGLIAVGVGALALLVGEIALATGAVGDLMPAVDLSVAEADGAGLAWGRIFAWEGAAHAAALGAGLTLGGVLSFIVTIVMPQIFAFNAGQLSAYDSLAVFGVGTAIGGVVAIIVGAVLAGVAVWLDGAVENAYDEAAGVAVAQGGELVLPRVTHAMAY